MTLITGQVSDVGMNNASGVFYARATEFRGDGTTVVSPSPATFTITDGVVSAEVQPGPTIITLHVGPVRKDWFVNVPETDVGLGDLIATYMEYEPAVVSAAIAARDAAVAAESEAKQAAIDAEAKRVAAETAAGLTGADRLHVDSVRALLDETYDESQAGMALPPRLTETALNATYGHEVGKTLYAPIEGIGAPVDIWDEFDKRGGGTSWAAETYAEWIAGIDARMAGADASKESIGQDSSGNDIWCWTAGNPAAPHALVVGGAHPSEMLAQWAAMRFFTEFATSAHPVMVALRKRARVSWIPTVVPENYGVQKWTNSGVNLNRNFDYLWKYYAENLDPSDPEQAGTAPFSESPAQAIKGLLDSTQIACVIDCHNLGGGPEMQVYAGVSSTLRNTRVQRDAVALWGRTFNADDTTTSSVSIGGLGTPTLNQWSEYYLRFGLDRGHASSTTLEGRVDMHGSVTGVTATRAAMRAYCGMIHSWIVAWIDSGPTPPTPLPTQQVFRRVLSDPDLGVGQGGTGLQYGGLPRLHFDRVGVNAVYSKNYVDFIVPCPGWVEITCDISFENKGQVETHVRLSLTRGESPTDGSSTAVDVESNRYGLIPAAPVGATAFHSGHLAHSFYYQSVGAQPMAQRFGLVVANVGADPQASEAYVRRAIMSVKFTPYWGFGYMPESPLG